MTEWANSYLPEWLLNRMLGVPLWQWIGIGVALAISMAFGAVAQVSSRWALRMNQAQASSGRAMARAVGLAVASLAFAGLVASLELSPSSERNALTAAKAGGVLAVVLLVLAIWDLICDGIAAKTTGVDRAERLLVPLLRRAVHGAILLAGVFLGASVFVGPDRLIGLVAGLGIGGILVALAAKDSVENVFGSLTLLFDMPFAIGDWVKIGAVEGVVEEINLRSTRLRTFEDSLIMLPNSNLIKAPVENFGARRFRRQRFFVRLSFDSPHAAVDAFVTQVREYVISIPNTVPARAVVEVNDVSEFSFGILVQCFVETDQYREEARMRNDLLLEILRLAGECKVRFAGGSGPT